MGKTDAKLGLVRLTERAYGYLQKAMAPDQFDGPIGRTLPKWVYDPTTDRIRGPLLPDPASIASSIARIVEEPRLYEKMSAAASDLSLSRFQFEPYLKRMLSILTDEMCEE